VARVGAPLVSVVLAVHDAERYLRLALDSVLRQTFRELELVVVDDGSGAPTREILAALEDPRLVVVRNDERRGLASSLNRGLDHAQGRYIARLDADDVALPGRLDRQLARIGGRVGVVGSGVMELDAEGAPGAVQLMPEVALAVRWHALFSSPFYHPTVLFDRELLDRHGLRYDETYAESEDYDLWARCLRVTEGVNIRGPLVLYRVHSAQATQRRRGVQRSYQRQIALREISRVAPELNAMDAERAWLVGIGDHVPQGELDDAVDAYLLVLDRFVAAHRKAGLRPVKAAAARVLVRTARAANGRVRGRLLRRAVLVNPLLPIDAAAAHAQRWAARRTALEHARANLAA
jgi:glycosyltransferase involved in cell wall biosynthesis